MPTLLKLARPCLNGAKSMTCLSSWWATEGLGYPPGQRNLQHPPGQYTWCDIPGMAPCSGYQGIWCLASCSSDSYDGSQDGRWCHQNSYTSPPGCRHLKEDVCWCLPWGAFLDRCLQVENSLQTFQGWGLSDQVRPWGSRGLGILATLRCYWPLYDKGDDDLCCNNLCSKTLHAAYLRVKYL